jgi:hypothetical protein
MLQGAGVALVVLGLAWGLKVGLRALGAGPNAALGLGFALSLLVAILLVALARSSGWLGGFRGHERRGSAVTNGERRNPWQRSAQGRWTSSLVLALLGTALAIDSTYRPVGRALFGCLALVGVIGVVRHFWIGGIEVVWDPATLTPGRRAVFHVATTDGSSRLLGARYLLRCVGRDASPEATYGRTVPAALSVLVECDPAVDEEPGPGEFVGVEFDVPPDAPPTGSSGGVSTRWELLVHGRSTWGSVTEVFDVPVVAAAPAVALAAESASA